MIPYPTEIKKQYMDRVMKLGKLNKRLKTLDTRRGGLPAIERTRGRRHTEMRIRILIRDRFTCQICKTQYAKHYLEVDHIVPLHLGGNERDNNRQTLCLECHQEKSKKEEKNRG